MNKEQHPEIFTDELAGIMFGYPVSKLTFVAVKQVGDDGSAEKTQVLTLTIPTQSLINACNLILDNARMNQKVILDGASTSEAKLLESLRGDATVSLTETPTVMSKKAKTARAVKGK